VAIYHYSAKVIGRSTGRSVTAAAAYRAGVDIFDSRTGQAHNYARRGGVIETEIMAPAHAKDWVQDRSELWNTVEHTEKRKDAQLAREVEISLPHELDRDQRRALLSSFVKNQYVEKGMIADVSYHEPGKGGDDRNYHAHILLTLRPLNEDGVFENKERDWNKKEVLIADREAWADYLNRELKRVGSKDRVDARSFEERGINHKATKHLGPDASEMERRGEHTRIGDENREAQKWNHTQAELEEDKKIIDLAVEREKRRLLREKLEKEEGKAPLPASRQNALFLKHLDERRALEGKIDRDRAAMEATNKQFYDKAQTLEALRQTQEAHRSAQTLLGRLSGREQQTQQRMEALQRNLEDIERRTSERQGFFNKQAQEQFQALEKQQGQETEPIHSPASQEMGSETEDFREHTPDYRSFYRPAANDNERPPEQTPDRDDGPSLDR